MSVCVCILWFYPLVVLWFFLFNFNKLDKNVILFSMKKVLFLTLLALVFPFSLISATPVNARVGVRGYYRRNGTYVQPYYRSSPNVYRWDNYSYRYYQPRYNPSYFNRSYRYNSPLYTPDYSFFWNR